MHLHHYKRVLHDLVPSKHRTGFSSGEGGGGEATAKDVAFAAASPATTTAPEGDAAGDATGAPSGGVQSLIGGAGRTTGGRARRIALPMRSRTSLAAKDQQ